LVNLESLGKALDGNAPRHWASSYDWATTTADCYVNGIEAASAVIDLGYSITDDLAPTLACGTAMLLGGTGASEHDDRDLRINDFGLWRGRVPAVAVYPSRRSQSDSGASQLGADGSGIDADASPPRREDWATQSRHP